MENKDETKNENSDDGLIWLNKRQNRIKKFLLTYKITNTDDAMECLRGILSINTHFRRTSYTAELYYLVMFKMLMENYNSNSITRINHLVDRNPNLEDFRIEEEDLEIYKKVGLETLYQNIIYNLGI